MAGYALKCRLIMMLWVVYLTYNQALGFEKYCFSDTTKQNLQLFIINFLHYEKASIFCSIGTWYSIMYEG